MQISNIVVNRQSNVLFKRPQEISENSSKSVEQESNKKNKNKILYALGGLAVLGATYAICHKKKNNVISTTQQNNLPIIENLAKNKKFFNQANEEVVDINLVQGKLLNSKGEPFNGFFEQVISDTKKVKAEYIDGRLSKSFINDQIFREYFYDAQGKGNIIEVIDYNSKGGKLVKKTFSYQANGKVKTLKIDKYNKNLLPDEFLKPRAQTTDYKTFSEKGCLIEEIHIENLASAFTYNLHNPETKTKEMLKCSTAGARGPVKLIYQNGNSEKVAFAYNIDKGFYKEMNKDDAIRMLDLIEKSKKYINEKYVALDRSLMNELKFEIKQKYGIVEVPKKLYHVTTEANFDSICRDGIIKKSLPIIGDGVFISDYESLCYKYPKETVANFIKWYSEPNEFGVRKLKIFEIPVEKLEKEKLNWREISLQESLTEPISQEWKSIGTYTDKQYKEMHKNPLEFLYEKEIPIGELKTFDVTLREISDKALIKEFLNIITSSV